ncbi:hypothetical protein ACFSUK_33370 [Sphingobium scionense]
MGDWMVMQAALFYSETGQPSVDPVDFRHFIGVDLYLPCGCDPSTGASRRVARTEGRRRSSTG